MSDKDAKGKIRLEVIGGRTPSKLTDTETVPNTPFKAPPQRETRHALPFGDLDATGAEAVAEQEEEEPIREEEPVLVEQAAPIVQIRRKAYANTYKTGLYTDASHKWNPRDNIILRRDDRALNGRPVYDGMTLILSGGAEEFYCRAHHEMRKEHKDDEDFHLTLLAPLSFLYTPDSYLREWLKGERGVYATNLHTEALLELKENAVYREVEKNLPVHARGNTLPCSVNGYGARMEHVRQAAPLTMQAVARANSYIMVCRDALQIARDERVIDMYVYYILEVYAYDRMVDASTRFQIDARMAGARRAHHILVSAIKVLSRQKR